MEKKILQPGAVLRAKRDYTIMKKLGEGGYGVTYLAQHTQQGHNIPDLYAIKEFFLPKCCLRNADGSVTMIDTDDKSAKEYRKSFKLEAEHLMDMNKYSGIVHVQEIFETNGTIYYVMEHLGDTSLDILLKSNGGRIDEELAIHLTESIGKSLSLLHDKKMNHLDVKPDNIMLVGKGTMVQPVLIDFGLSRHYNIMGKVTNDMAAMGVSDGYSPAEQYVGMDTFSPTADIYALAATLFHMLTGHVPVRATKVNEQYLRNELRGKTSDGRITAIVNAMRMNATERTQSIDDFLKDLGIALNVNMATGGTVDISRMRKNEINWIYVAGAVIIAALIAVIVLFATKDCNGNTENSNPEVATDTIRQSVVKENSEKEDSTKTSDAKQTQTEQETMGSQGQVVAQKPEPKSDPQPSIGRGSLNLGYAVWTGEIKNGKPNGLGTMTYREDHRVDSRDASETYAAAGDRMKGEFRNGHWEYGTLYSASGTTKANISIGAE